MNAVTSDPIQSVSEERLGLILRPLIIIDMEFSPPPLVPMKRQ